MPPVGLLDASRQIAGVPARGPEPVNGIASRDVDKAAWLKDGEGNSICAHETLAS